jgi:hypothetical protein
VEPKNFDVSVTIRVSRSLRFPEVGKLMRHGGQVYLDLGPLNGWAYSYVITERVPAYSAANALMSVGTHVQVAIGPTMGTEGFEFEVSAARVAVVDELPHTADGRKLVPMRKVTR